MCIVQGRVCDSPLPWIIYESTTLSPIYPSSSYHCLAFWLALGAPLIAAAHGGEVRIELNVTQASPGVTIDLRSSGFEPGDTTTIMLVNAERQQLPGAATADDHGDLAWAVSLPIDLTTGAYEVRVADTHHMAAAPLNIVLDSSGDEEGGQRGEDEPLQQAPGEVVIFLL